jgi:hypothetical protein
MLLKLENRVTHPNLTPIIVNAVGSSSVIIEVMAVIGFGFGARSEGGFGLRKTGVYLRLSSIKTGSMRASCR